MEKDIKYIAKVAKDSDSKYYVQIEIPFSHEDQAKKFVEVFKNVYPRIMLGELA